MHKNFKLKIHRLLSKKISILVFNPFSVAVKYGRMTKRARDAVYQEFKNEFCKTDDDESGPDTPNSIDNGSFLL